MIFSLRNANCELEPPRSDSDQTPARGEQFAFD